MKNIIFVCLLLNYAFLTAQNVFVWDRDQGYTIINPEDPWTYVGMEYSLINALQANNITPTVGEVLPDNLPDYDILFATVGIWCDG